MNDDEAREIVRATLAHHVHGTWHGYTHAEVRQALERALELFEELERLRVVHEATVNAKDALRSKVHAQRHEIRRLRALVAALREVRSGDGHA